jgi:hypothetical protein
MRILVFPRIIAGRTRSKPTAPINSVKCMGMRNFGLDHRFGQLVYWGGAASECFLEADKLFERSEFLSAGRKYPDAAGMMIKAEISNYPICLNWGSGFISREYDVGI